MTLIIIALGENSAGATLSRYLERGLTHRDTANGPFQIGQHSLASQTYLTCQLSRKDLSGHGPIYYLASALTEYIVDEYEMELIQRLISQEFETMLPEERSAILLEAEAILQGRSHSSLTTSARLQSKSDIMNALMDYLSAEDLLILEGFVHFRLGKYKRYLRHLVHMAAESIRRERAHREFTMLLRCFVEMQEPHIEVAHVIVRPNGLYRVLDSTYSLVDNEYLEGLPASFVKHELDLEDLLISALLAIAPSNIILHFPPNWLTTDAIQSIFAGRVQFCPGCTHCEGSYKAIEAIKANQSERS